MHIEDQLEITDIYKKLDNVIWQFYHDSPGYLKDSKVLGEFMIELHKIKERLRDFKLKEIYIEP